MFGDLDWPLNASRGFVSISWASCTEHWSDLPPAPLNLRPYGAIEIQLLLFFMAFCCGPQNMPPDVHSFKRAKASLGRWVTSRDRDGDREVTVTVTLTLAELQLSLLNRLLWFYSFLYYFSKNQHLLSRERAHKSDHTRCKMTFNNNIAS